MYRACAFHVNNKSHMRILSCTLKCDQMLISAGLHACCVVAIFCSRRESEWRGLGGGRSGPWGLRTKSHFIPNQVVKSAPILGSPDASARLWSAFTFGLHDNIWLVYKWKSMVSLSQPWVHVSCLQSQLGTRWPRTRNVGLILMIKPQCFVGTVNWKKKKTCTSYYDLKAWFLFAVNCHHTIKVQLAWKIILSHSCDPKPCSCHFYIASHPLRCMHANRGKQCDTAAQCTVRKCL